jgi:hypothetical protein
MNSRRFLPVASWRDKVTRVLAVGLVLLFPGTATAGAVTMCQVSIPRLNLREGPSMDARITRVLNGRNKIRVAGGCNRGWVRVVSALGATRGYVGGWALHEVSQEGPSPGASVKKGAAAAAPGVTAEGLTRRTEEVPSMPPAGIPQQETDSRETRVSGQSFAATWVFDPEEGNWSYHSPKGGSALSTEALAVQMTENRLKVLALERRMQLVERALAKLRNRPASSGQGQ